MPAAGFRGTASGSAVSDGLRCVVSFRMPDAKGTPEAVAQAVDKLVGDLHPLAICQQPRDVSSAFYEQLSGVLALGATRHCLRVTSRCL